MEGQHKKVPYQKRTNTKGMNRRSRTEIFIPQVENHSMKSSIRLLFTELDHD